jgi:hypothetical protein
MCLLKANNLTKMYGSRMVLYIILYNFEKPTVC